MLTQLSFICLLNCNVKKMFYTQGFDLLNNIYTGMPRLIYLVNMSKTHIKSQKIKHLALAESNFLTNA